MLLKIAILYFTLELILKKLETNFIKFILFHLDGKV